MKRIIAVILSAMLLASMHTAAFAWTCTQCGADNDAKFCVECGTKKPQENVCPHCGTNFGDKTYTFCIECGMRQDASAVQTPVPESSTPAPAQGPVITGIVRNENNTVDVYWQGDASQTYTIRTVLKLSEDVYADMAAPAAMGVRSYEATGTGYRMGSLAPEADYWIGVFDAQGNGGYRAYSSEPVQAFTDMETEMQLESFIRTGETKTQVEAFTAEDFADPAAECGMRVGFYYTNPGAERKILFQMVINGPENSAARDLHWVLEGAWSTLRAQTEGSVGWGFYELDAFFSRLAGSYPDGIPTGEYTVDIYADGRLVDTKPLQVIEKAEEKALEITGVNHQGDGTVLLTWADNGKGPYSVYYYECWSNDPAADRKDERTSAYWVDEADMTGTSLVMTNLVPGKKYWIEVEDSQENVERVICSMPEAKPSAMGMSISITPRKRADGVLTDYTAFSSPALTAEHTADYGLHMELRYNPVPANTQKRAQIVLTLPNGVSFCEYAVDLNLYDDGYTYWEFYSLNWFFDCVNKWNDGVLTGTYVMTIYVEGQEAASTSFTVSAADEASLQESGVSVDAITPLANGSLNILWSDIRDNGPYRIEYGQKVSDNFSDDWNGETHSIFLIATEEARGGSYILNYVTPGLPMWIVVLDANGSGAYQAYESQEGEVHFSEFKVQLSAQPLTRKNDQVSKVSFFSAAEIAADTKEFGVNLSCDYPQLARERNYRLLVTIEAPNGTVLADSTTDYTLSKGKKGSFSWEFYSLEWYFNTLSNKFGSVPKGQHTIKLYFDGELADSAVFSVN